MDRWKNQVAIVTGATAGIGAAIVENLLNYDIKVVGLARRKNILDEMTAKYRGKQFYGIKTDMRNEADILNAFRWVKENLGPISILINNAGIIKSENLISTDAIDLKDVLDTNVFGLAIATREAIRNMRDNGVDGHVININCVGGHYVAEVAIAVNVYCATKFAVTALTETLRQELNAIQSKIKVTLVAFIRDRCYDANHTLTGSYLEVKKSRNQLLVINLSNKDAVSPGVVATDLYTTGMLKSGIDRMSTLPKLDTKHVADAVAYVLSTPPSVLVTELTIRPIGEPF